jgi:acetyl esterase
MPSRLRAIFLFMLLSTPAQAVELRGVEYARPNGESLLFDAGIPNGDGPFPAVILVHGGGWVRGDRHTEVAPLFAPLTNAGIAWFSIDYRLAKDPINFGIAYRDVQAAVRYLKIHAIEYHIDPDRIALMGESAGGHLAAMAALSTAPDLQVKTVVAFYAPTNLASLAQNAGMIPDTIREKMNGGMWGTMIMALLTQLSPIEHLHRDMPPFLLIHGTDDSLVPIHQSREMCDRMKALGNECEVYPVKGGGHGLRRWKPEAYQPEMLRWLNRHL